MLLSMLMTAQAGNFGLGLAFGAPTGVTGKIFLSNTGAIDILVGEMWDDGWWYEEDLVLSVDYLSHVAELAQGSDARLDFYIGGGANLWFGDWNESFAAEMPIGLSVMFQNAPVELFVELAPMIMFRNDVDFVTGGSLGARYYF